MIRRRTIRFTIALLTIPLVVLCIFAVAVFALGSPRYTVRPAIQPLNLSTNGVHGAYNFAAENGRIALYNFRAVEPGVLYRGSGFIRFGVTKRNGVAINGPLDTSRRVIDLLRQHNVHQVITLEEPQYAAAERGYFDYWRRRIGYNVDLVSWPVPPQRAYSNIGRDTALHAGVDLIRLLRTHRPRDGAIYIHCSDGKDRTGVAVAAYELWRNQGTTDEAALWRQVMQRYLVSNTLIERLPPAARAGLPATDCNRACTSGECAAGGCSTTYACPCWLEWLRFDLELVAQLPL
jgi:hypothetical protein